MGQAIAEAVSRADANKVDIECYHIKQNDNIASRIMNIDDVYVD